MAQVIQCPTCAKKFKLPERPPATFTCTGCATVMDLSAFRAPAAAEAPAPAAAAAAAAAPAGAPRTGGGGARTSRSGAGEGRSGAGEGRSAAGEGRSAGGAGTRTSRVSASRRARVGDDDEEGGRGGLPPPKDNSKVLLLGSLAAFVVIGLVAFLVLSKEKPKPPPDPNAPGATPLVATDPAAGMATAAAGMGTTSHAGTGTTPAAGETPPAEKPAPSRGPGIIKEVGHHPDATEDERKNIDHLIDVAIFQNAGRDSRDAEQQLIAIGIKAAPRLINVFYTVKMDPKEGYESRLGKMKVGIADRALRSIDGYVDRGSRGKITLVTAASDPKFVETIAKRWSGWWENGYYKDPKKPWDERTEGNRGEKQDTSENPTDGGK